MQFIGYVFGGTYRKVNGKAGRVDCVHVAFGLNDAVLVHQTQVIWSHVLERLAEWINPEMVSRLSA